MESSDLSDLDAADPMIVATALRACRARLRDGTLEGDALFAFAAKLDALAAHDSHRVRQAVAETMPFVSDAAYAKLHAVLSKDKSPYVRSAVEDAAKQRSTIKRDAARDDEHDQRLDRWWRELDATGARRVAERVAAHETEYFVRRMHHEAGNAVGDARRALKKLREGVDAPDIDRAATRASIERLAERLTFVEHVLDTGRARAKSDEPTFAPVNVGALVRDEAALLAGRFSDRAVAVESDVADVTIDADAAFLRQAFANILKNAVEAHDGDARVRVSVRSEGTHAVVVIEDRGRGFHPGSLDRAFVPFGSTKPGGTGFGLFIARRVARNVHGGELRIASEAGSGTSGTMRLPVKQEKKKRRK